MKPLLSIGSAIAVLVLLTACAGAQGGDQPAPPLPICNADYSNMPCQIPPAPPPLCPPGSIDPTDPSCPMPPPMPPLPHPPPHR